MSDFLTPELRAVADKWFEIYENRRLRGDTDMSSPEITELVGGYDNHGSIIYNYNAMWDYIDNNSDKYEEVLTPELKEIADKWFKIYVALQKGGGLNMMSPKITKLVGGYDNHGSIIYNYSEMSKYMKNKM